MYERYSRSPNARDAISQGYNQQFEQKDHLRFNRLLHEQGETGDRRSRLKEIENRIRNNVRSIEKRNKIS
jgi:hypothetical protein